ENLDDLTDYFGHALAIGVQTPVNFFVDADAADPTRNLAYLWQDGLGLPDRDYYLSDHEQLVETRKKYQAHVGRLLNLAGWADDDDAAGTVIGLERKLADIHWSRERNRDRATIYTNKFTEELARALTPDFDWARFLDAAGFGKLDQFVIAQTDYFQALATLLHETPLDDWKTYLRFKLLKAYAPYLNQDFVEEDFDFQGRILRGQQQLRPRWKRGVRLINTALGEMVGKHYVQRHFPPESRQRVQQLVENLRQAFAQSINSLDWMAPETKAQARKKLASFTSKIGYPDKWRNYDALEIRADDLVGNVMRSRAFEHAHEASKLHKPVDRSEWGMTPQTVNAYYRATMNEIVFPAAILQPPFFDPAADDAVNYGAIGSVIGHEFSHGFDDQGRKFDGEGRLRDWWTEKDTAEYERRAQVLVAQYEKYEPVPGIHINGQVTLGENIADLAGMVMAHRAYQLSLDGRPSPVIDGYTGEQRLFIGYALGWRTKYRQERLREMLLSDPHSPARYRVNGVLRNLPEFYSAFDVKPGDPMYLPPEQRAKIW
ncbi:MAG TPA: M13 family peptidase, partial [Chromatiales bacterium]|nr:M13 family peptidase [Chromatiales bacterium]